tara:strand:- start:57 stop:1706 length:1650 start_codon:yes stop_codon:yes gene_type:complete
MDPFEFEKEQLNSIKEGIQGQVSDFQETFFGDEEWNQGLGKKAFYPLRKLGETQDTINDQLNLRNMLRISKGVTDRIPGQLDERILDYSYKDLRDHTAGGIGNVAGFLSGGNEQVNDAGELLGQVLLPDAVDFATGGIGYIDNLARVPKALKKISAKDGARIVEDVFSRSKFKAGQVYRGAQEGVQKVVDTVTSPIRTAQDLLTGGMFGRGGPGTGITGGGSSARFGGKMSNLYPDHVNLVNNKLREFGMEDGIFRYDTFVGKVRKAADGTPPSIGRTESREFVELFQSVKNMAENFKVIRDKGRHVEFKSRWVDFLKSRDINPANVQLHHVNALYDSLPLYDGLRFDSDEWWDLTAELLRNNVRPGTTFHKGKPNLMSVLGYSNQTGLGATDAMPHGVAHLFYKDKLVDFFNADELEKMRTIPGYRLQKAQDYSEIVNKSEDIVEQAMKTFEVMNPRGNMDFERTLEFLSGLDDNGLLDTKIIDGRYQVPQLKQMIEGISREMDKLPKEIILSDEAFEGWLLNLLVDKNISNRILNPVKRKIKKRYSK